MSGNIRLQESVANTYDEISYESTPYSQSYPSHLKTLGILFGMDPTLLEKARILELGCSHGGNIIPIAYNFPNSEILGIDLSKKQIDLANTYVKDLNLKNIKFKQCSILDVNESFGKFDYIIAHGVLSWVSEEVRAKIFEICGKLLTNQGIAYISYNTLPGWNMVKSIRDMMLYHASFFYNVTEKVIQARSLLNFVNESLEGQNTPYALFLKQEANFIANLPDHYLRHDHLEETNYPYYFRDFITEAQNQGLKYLSDSSIATMFLGNMPPKVSEKLSAITDIVQVEQYMDFINNRRFRASLLCKSNVLLNRALKSDDINKFYLLLKITPEKPLKEVELNNTSEELKFFYNNNTAVYVSTSSPIMKAILYTFSENTTTPLMVDDIVKLSSKKIKSPNVDIKNELLSQAMSLVLKGLINIYSDKITNLSAITDKPKVSVLVRYQAEKMPILWVTNNRHECIVINFFDKCALRYMDGTLTKEQIVTKVIENHLKKGEITLSRDNKPVIDETEILREMNLFMEQCLSRLLQGCLLI